MPDVERWSLLYEAQKGITWNFLFLCPAAREMGVFSLLARDRREEEQQINVVRQTAAK
jgi:hypothetical protein